MPGHDASNIQVLEGLEAVRRRPGMYIGSTDVRGLHHLVYEVVDNSVDEALAGVLRHASTSSSTRTTRVTVARQRPRHPGRHAQPDAASRRSRLVMTVLHAGGKFGGGGYKVSGGLHGVGVSVVNALSELAAGRGAPRRRQALRPGVRARQAAGGQVKAVGDADRARHHASPSWPTTRSSRSLDYDYDIAGPALPRDGLPDQGAAITFVDERARPRGHLLLRGRHRLVRAPPQQEPQRAAPAADLRRARGRAASAVEVALQYNDGFTESVYCLRQQHQHHRRRHAPDRLPHGADAHAQRLRPQGEHAQGQRRRT